MKNRFSILVLFSAILLTGLTAFNSGIELKNQSPSTPVDSVINDKVLIITFDPGMYFSDADEDIAKGSKIGRELVVDKIRGNIEASIYEKLNVYYDAKRLMKKSDGFTDLQNIYNSIEFKPEKRTNPNYQKRGNTKLADIKKVIRNSGDHDRDDNKQEAEYLDYMNISIGNPNLIPYLVQKYNVDYFLFINQFEIKTNYKKCLDLATKNYQREFVAHFTIIDKNGRHVDGNVIRVSYSSNENDIKKIVTDNFGNFGLEVMNFLPKPGITSN